MFIPKKDFEFNLLSIENYNRTPRMLFLEKFLKKNLKIPGDYFEFGVFKGSSIISVALLFKKLGIKKKLYGFDSFGGFPGYSKYDDFKNFKEMFKNKQISKSHLKDIENFTKIKKILSKLDNTKNSFHPKSISSSRDFSSSSYSLLKKKINLLNLQNIRLIRGDFKKTIPKFFKNNPKKKIFLANIDCDLYESYMTVFRHSWDKLSKNGIFYLDEYYSLKFPGARIATDKFLLEKKIQLKKLKTWNTDFERWYIKK